MNDKRSAAVKLIEFDYGESPYTNFEQYWKDHTKHYIIVLGPHYDEVNKELTDLYLMFQ